jgi:hypothetical protein
MDIPTHVFENLNESNQDPKANSILCTFESNLNNSKEYHIYKLPYHKDVFWTNYRIECEEPYYIETNLITSNNFTYTLHKEQNEPNKWYTLYWSLPSTSVTDGGIYLEIHGPKEIKITLLGFHNLFPTNYYYILTSKDGTHQFVFSQISSSVFEEESNAMIYNVENADYIMDIINIAQIIKPNTRV